MSLCGCVWRCVGRLDECDKSAAAHNMYYIYFNFAVVTLGSWHIQPVDNPHNVTTINIIKTKYKVPFVFDMLHGIFINTAVTLGAIIG